MAADSETGVGKIAISAKRLEVSLKEMWEDGDEWPTVERLGRQQIRTPPRAMVGFAPSVRLDSVGNDAKNYASNYVS